MVLAVVGAFLVIGGFCDFQRSRNSGGLGINHQANA